MKDQIEIAIAKIEAGLDRAGRNHQNLNRLMENLRLELDRRVGPSNDWSEEYEQAACLKSEIDLMAVTEKKLEKKLEKVF